MNETNALFFELRTLDKSENPSDVKRHAEIVARLVELYRALVAAIAREMLLKLGLRSDDLDDLIGEGNLALMRAINRFDPEQNVPFSSYAGRFIEGAMRHYARDKSALIREPARVYEAREADEAPRVIATCAGLPGQSSDEDAASGPLDARCSSDFVSLSDLRLTLEAFLTDRQAKADTGTDADREKWTTRRAVLELHFGGQPVIEIARRLDINYSHACYNVRAGIEDLRAFCQE